jgi:hypothetical protein
LQIFVKQVQGVLGQSTTFVAFHSIFGLAFRLNMIDGIIFIKIKIFWIMKYQCNPYHTYTTTIISITTIQTFSKLKFLLLMQVAINMINSVVRFKVGKILITIAKTMLEQVFHAKIALK